MMSRQPVGHCADGGAKASRSGVPPWRPGLGDKGSQECNCENLFGSEGVFSCAGWAGNLNCKWEAGLRNGT